MLEGAAGFQRSRQSPFVSVQPTFSETQKRQDYGLRTGQRFREQDRLEPCA